MRLGDFMTLKRGHDLPADVRISGSIPVVSSSGISGYHNEAKAEPPGVVTGRYGTLGEVFYMDQPYWPLNTALYVIDFKGNDPKFSAYFLRNVLKGHQSDKAAVPGFDRNVLHEIKVGAPSLSTQRRIAEILSAYDDLIENNQRRMTLLEESARMLYQEWFVRFHFPGYEHAKIVNGIPDGWLHQKIGDLCSKIGSGATPRGGEAAYQVDGISLIRSQNVYDDKFDDDGLAKISEEQAKLLESVSVQSRDILLNITGASVARCCMAPDRHLPARVNQHVMIIRVKEELCSPFFVHASINSETNKKQLLAVARAGGATREALTKDAVASFEVVIPERSLINEFHRITSAAFEQHEKLEESNKKLRSARDILLPRLMSGEIEV